MEAPLYSLVVVLRYLFNSVHINEVPVLYHTTNDSTLHDLFDYLQAMVVRHHWATRTCVIANLSH